MPNAVDIVFADPLLRQPRADDAEAVDEHDDWHAECNGETPPKEAESAYVTHKNGNRHECRHGTNAATRLDDTEDARR